MVKTCEEYVIEKLIALEKENEILKQNLEVLNTQFADADEELCHIKNILERRAKIKKIDGVSAYISLTIWARTWEPDQLEDYENLLSLVDIQMEEPKEETEEEDGNEE